MSTNVAVAITGLTKRYRDVVAVDQLTLNITRGEIYGFLGLNGAGKTTTIRLLLGMIRPDTGTVSLFGERIRPGITSVWQQVGYMVETPHAYTDLTVQENLEIFRRLRRLKDTSAVPKIIKELKLEQYARRRAGTLSLGNAQRLGLAKALMHHPDLLILDEPTNALDPAGIIEIRNLLHSLADHSGVTVFVSSHILGEVSRLATRIGIIHEGRLVKEISALELAEQEGRRLIVDVKDTGPAVSVLGKAGISAMSEEPNRLAITNKEALSHPDEIATLLVQAGCPPTKLVIEQKDLESYFLKLVGIK